jgi:hypothetical protein
VKESYAHNPELRYSMLNNAGVLSNRFYLDENNDGKADFYISNPDFNFQEFRSNFVLRWEYRAGSTLYLVWSHDRSKYEDLYNASILDSFSGISGLKSENLFMVKFSYWFAL